MLDAHGIFDGQAKARSPQTWLVLHKRGVLAAVGAAATGAAVLSARR